MQVVEGGGPDVAIYALYLALAAAKRTFAGYLPCMGGLFLFIYRIRVFLLFAGLQALCLFLLVNTNSYQGAVWLTGSNAVTGRINEITAGINDYFYLTAVNAELAAENARLNAELQRLQAQNLAKGQDTMHLPFPVQYKYRVAKVINNSVSRVKNYITINRGLTDGILPGMGVVSAGGIVGRVKNCSAHYSTVTSLLHTDMLVSASVKRINAFGTLSWRGDNPYKAALLYIARHIKPVTGDTVVTSDYSTVYPSGIPVGRISRIHINDNETFYDIDVALSTDFSTLSYVYVIENTQKAERDSLQAGTTGPVNTDKP